MIAFFSSLFHEFLVYLVDACLAIGLIGLLGNRLLRLIPITGIELYRPLIIIVSFVLFSIGLFYNGVFYSDEKWEAKNAELIAQNKQLQVDAKNISTQVRIEYVDRVKVIKEKGEKVTEYVPQIITKEVDRNCTLTDGFVWLLDSAAKAQISGAPRGTNGTPSTPTDTKK